MATTAVVPIPPAPRRPGRPSKLTPEARKRILQAAERQQTNEDMARLVGVHPATFQAWLAKGRAATSGEYREFHELIEGTRAGGKAKLVTKVWNHAQRDPEMAFRLLARRYPKEYGVNATIEVTEPEQPTRTVAQAMAELRARLEEMRERKRRAAVAIQNATGLKAIAASLEERDEFEDSEDDQGDDA